MSWFITEVLGGLSEKFTKFVSLNVIYGSAMLMSHESLLEMQNVKPTSDLENQALHSDKIDTQVIHRHIREWHCGLQQVIIKLG